MDDLELGIAETETHWRTDTESADAIIAPSAFQIATAWSKSLPAELVQRFAYKSAPTLFAAIIIHSQARDDRQYNHIVPLEHFQACAEVVQLADNLWSNGRNASRQKVPTLILLRELYVEGRKQEHVASDYDMAQQTISERIGRALEIFDQEHGQLCRCDDLTLLSVCYNACIGWNKRSETLRRLQDSVLVPKVPFRFRKVPQRLRSYKTIIWQPGEREALIQDYLDNGGTITKCPTPPNWWSDVTTRPRQRKINLAVRARHEAQVEKFLRGSQLISRGEISKLNAEAA